MTRAHGLFDYADRLAGENRAPFVDLPYLRQFCASLEDCAAGLLPDGARNLACCIAPRHYKTSFGSRAFPAWALAEMAPDCEFILTSYSESLVVDSAIAVRQAITQPWHQALYPHLRISSEDRDLKQYFKTTAGGSVYATALGGTITGFGAGKARRGFGGAIIIDDPLKANDAKSEVMRKNVIDYYNNTLKSRRNSVHNTPIILIAQRLHPDDLLGWILKHEPEAWHVVSFPALGENGVLNPMTTSREELERLRDVAPQVFWSQYQQTPMIEGGNIIRMEWWKTYPAQDEPRGQQGGLIFLTADTAYKAKKDSDASVIRVWEGTRDALYCLDAIHGRWEFPMLLRKAQEFWKLWKDRGAREFWVEDKASGTPLAQTLRDNGVPAEDWRPHDFGFPEDKVGRMNEAAWSVHGGRVLLPEGPSEVLLADNRRLCVTPQARLLVEECAAFAPNMSHSHDDHCDTLTMAVSLWRAAGGGR